MRYVMRIVLHALGYAIATAAVGWWIVPVLAAVWGLLERPWIRAARTAGIAAGLGWAGLLALAGAQGPVGTLAHRLGAVFGGVPGSLMLVLTVLFAMLLAGAAAGFVSAVRPASFGL